MMMMIMHQGLVHQVAEVTHRQRQQPVHPSKKNNTQLKFSDKYAGLFFFSPPNEQLDRKFFHHLLCLQLKLGKPYIVQLRTAN